METYGTNGVEWIERKQLFILNTFLKSVLLARRTALFFLMDEWTESKNKMRINQNIQTIINHRA